MNNPETSAYDEVVEEIKRRLEKEYEEWWSYPRLKAVGGYIGICVLMAFHKLGPFDKTSQCYRSIGIPKSTFYFLLNELKDYGLIFVDDKGKKGLTKLGKKVCEILESSGHIISKAKLLHIIEELKYIRFRDRR